MDEKIILCNTYLLIKKDIANKIKNIIYWEEDPKRNIYVFKYNDLKFSKSKNINDSNYCYLNYSINTTNKNYIFETENCLIAYIIALCH
jgi:hypothetical protein